MKRLFAVVIVIVGVLLFMLMRHRGTPNGAESSSGSPGPSTPHAEGAPDTPVPGPNTGLTKEEYAAKLLSRGRELVKNAPDPTTIAWLTWYNKLSSEDKLAYLSAVEEPIAATAVTEEQKKAVRIVDPEDNALHLFPAKLLVNYKPLLRMDERVSVRPLQIDTVRTANGLASTVWARRAKNSLVLDWSTNHIQPGNVDNSRTASNPAPSYVPPEMLFCTSGSKMVFSNGSDTQRSQWTRNSQLIDLALEPGYRYAFANEYELMPNDTRTLRSIVIYDSI